MDHLIWLLTSLMVRINGVVELYLLVLIGLLFNIHATFALGRLTTGPKFVLLLRLWRGSVSHSRSLDGLTGHEGDLVKSFHPGNRSMKYALILRFFGFALFFMGGYPRLPKPEIDQWQGGKRIAVLMN